MHSFAISHFKSYKHTHTYFTLCVPLLLLLVLLLLVLIFCCWISFAFVLLCANWVLYFMGFITVNGFDEKMMLPWKIGLWQTFRFTIRMAQDVTECLPPTHLTILFHLTRSFPHFFPTQQQLPIAAVYRLFFNNRVKL